MAEFQARELDLLEDALESLEEVDELESLELSSALTERLADYRDVLALCRDSFPLEDPAEAALVDVLAEAREVSRRAKLSDEVSVEVGGWRRFWERWRGTLIPGFALAGTAAAVLWMIDPQRLGGSDELLGQASDGESESESDDRKEEDAKSDQPASKTQIDDAGAAEEATTNSEEEASLAGEGQEASLPDAFEDAAPPGAEKKHKSSATKGAAPSKAIAEPITDQAPEPAPEPLGKDETWDLLAQGNDARLSGKCEGARQLYQQVIAAGTDSQAVARAHAGVGLCFEQEQRDDEADPWFEQARAENPGVMAWIDQQREEQPLSAAKKAKKSKAKSKKSSALEMADVDSL